MRKIHIPWVRRHVRTLGHVARVAQVAPIDHLAEFSALDAIELIHQAGGLAVMAHPGLNRTDEVIPKLVAAGMDGLECFHTKHTTSMTGHYLEIADAHHLLVTGGSDCHGLSKGKPLIGTVKIPYAMVERLKEEVTRRALAKGVQIASAPVRDS